MIGLGFRVRVRVRLAIRVRVRVRDQDNVLGLKGGKSDLHSLRVGLWIYIKLFGWG